MKTYKIKSLLYFSGFLMASILYYGIEQKQAFDEQLQTNQIAETSTEEQKETPKDLTVELRK